MTRDTCTPAGAATTATPSTVVSPDQGRSPVGDPGRELPEKRTRNSRTYVTQDGRSIMTRVFPTPVHYRAADGEWKAIDNALQPQDGAFRNKANRYVATLPARLGAGTVVKVADGSDQISFSLRDASAQGEVDGSQITYAGAVAGVDVRYEARAQSLKELLVLRERSAQRTFVFDLDVGDGLRPVLLRSGAVEIRDAAGEARMSIPAPFMTDADGAVSSAVNVALDRVTAGWRLTLSAGDRWLDAPSRAFPVEVDPQVFPNGQADCTLDQAAPSTDTCAGSTLQVGGGAGAERRGVLRFDIAGAVPYGSTITHAALGLYLDSQSTTTQGKLLYAHKLTQSFGSSATWNSPWTTAGGTFLPDAYCEHCPYVGGSSGGGGVQPGNRAYFNIRKLVDGWYKDASTNNGMLVRVDTISADANLLTFGSSESANQPFIDLRYEQRSGALRGHKYETEQLTDRTSLQVNSASGNLLVRQRDFTVPGGVGPDLTVGHSYNSKRREQSYSLGKGWSLDTGPDVRLERTPQDDVVFHGPSGYDALFERNADASYKTPIGYDAKLEAVLPSGWTYTENQSQRKLTFDVYGRLTKDEDRNGRALTFTYTGTGGEIQKITDSQGRDTTFAYTSGRITQITDSGGRLYKYVYNAGGELTKYTDPVGGDTLFEYGSLGLQLITSPEGRKTKVTYQTSGASYSRVASVIRATNPTAAFASLSGPTTQFAYTINGYGAQPPTSWPEESVVTDPLSHTVSTKFDKDSLPRETRDGLNRLTKTSYTTNANVMDFSLAANTGTTPNTSLTYDGDNNPTQSATPAASATANCATTPADCLIETAGYQTPGTVLGAKYLPSTQTDSEGKLSNLTYDAKGNPKTINKSNSTITLDYETGSTGKLTKITDANAHNTLYGYDTAGNLTTITPELPLGATTLTYTAAISRVATVTDGMNRTRTLTHDNLDRVTKITYADASYVQFVYDKDGNLTAQNDSVNGNMTATYDQLSHVLTQTKPGVNTTYTYDAAGNLNTIQDPGGTTTYSYDAANQNTSIQEPSVTGAITLAYDDNGQRIKTHYPNNVNVVARYDPAGRTSRIFSARANSELEADAFQRYDYTYATAGGTQRALRQSTTDVIANQTTAYDYDGLNRLDLARTYTGTPPSGTCVDAPALACYDPTIDPAGNRTALQVRGSTLTATDTTFSYNNANQLCWKKAAVVPSPTCASVPSGAAAYTHDADGNQTSNGAGRTLTYNNRDQTTSLAGISAGYLGAGQDDLTALGSTGLRNDLLGTSTRTPSSGAPSYYTRAPDGTILTQRTSSSREYYSHDALGSTTATTTEATGAPTQVTYAYDPDGNTTTTTGSSSNPFEYASGYQTPGNLYHYGQRYYDPQDARWTQTDPLDQATDLLEGNRYPYVGGDPINLSDPSGLNIIDDIDNITIDVTKVYNEYVRDPLRTRGGRILGRCLIGGGALAIAAATVSGPVGAAFVVGCVAVNVARRFR